MVDRFDALVGLVRLPLVHLNDTRSSLGSRTDRHEHVGAGQIGPSGLGALLRDARLAGTAFIMETPGADEGWDAVNLRRAFLLWSGAESLPDFAAEGVSHEPPVDANGSETGLAAVGVAVGSVVRAVRIASDCDGIERRCTPA